MFVTIVIAALIVDGLFGVLGLIPSGVRPSRADIFGSVQLDYKLVLNVLGAVIFATFFYLTIRRGVTDPVCGMRVDRSKAVTLVHEGHVHHFCSEHCRSHFEANPERYVEAGAPAPAPAHAHSR